ncbi:Malate dehydrogenase 2 [Spironucleus salmonicida]|uniref:malate dehydrogenase n=1 Tax=Spironucleus salmonicida TaxID=348837 RepID=K7R5G2_9EUKA|nr:malate dehydrogenase 2 [Spironucleus salmonicida]KAH0576332.1 Malate dehydrogenase 2 [Spironucleus salmonicida]|eukprot:EST44436.1 Malate dehydrogenase 2 [Spironucleus salmonicida]
MVFKAPIRVAVTGCSGHIAYSFLAELAKGWVFGEDQPVIIVFVEREGSNSSTGIQMELEDCAFQRLHGIEVGNQQEAFSNVDYIVMLGALARGPGMERSDLLYKNAKIFEEAGKNIQLFSRPDTKILVVGNPANTNALILAKFAPKVAKNIVAMSQLDHNRAIGQISKKCNVTPGRVQNVFVFGNHSTTMVPIFSNVTVDGKKVVFDQDWISNITAIIQKRGASIIQARGASSALSAAHGALDCIKSWHQGTRQGEIVSVSIQAQAGNFYSIPESLFCSVPCICVDGRWEIQKLSIEPFYNKSISLTIQELENEKKMAFGN